jgi:hypothetical protein
MFDKVSQVAEKLATNVSRRAFLGRLGQGALVLAGAMGAMLAFRGFGLELGFFYPGGGGGGGGGSYSCCCYDCGNGVVYSRGPGTNECSGNKSCKPTFKGCPLAAAYVCGCAPIVI